MIKEAFSQEFTIFNRPSSNGTDSVLENIKDAASREFTLSAPLPDVIVTGVIMQPPDALPGSDFTVAWRVTNLGPGRMPGSWTDTVYYSTDDIVGNDTVLGEVPHMGPDLLPGESADRQASFILPLVDGPYFIVVTTTLPGLVSESNGVNNTALSVDPIYVQPFEPPDLTITELIAPPSEVLSGSTTQVTFRVRNVYAEQRHLRALVDDSVFLSTAATLPTSLTNSQDLIRVGAASNPAVLQPGEEYVQTVDITMPILLEQTDFFLAVYTDSRQNVSSLLGARFDQEEEDEFNNWLVTGTPITVAIAPFQPDLVVSVFVKVWTDFEGDILEIGPGFEDNNVGVDSQPLEVNLNAANSDLQPTRLTPT